MDKHYRKDVFLGNAYFRKNLFLRGVQVFGVQSKIYFVDGNNGDDNNDGLSWANAKKTIVSAITAHTAYRATRSGESVDTYIIIAPATYAENIEALPYSCTMVGLGVPGTDKSVKIKPVAGPCIAATISGLRLINLRFEAIGTVDLLDFNICNNVEILNCDFQANQNNVSAISTENSSYLTVRNCRFGSGNIYGFEYAIYAAGGTDKFLHQALIENNYMSRLKATATGIYIASNCNADEALIKDNVIMIPGAGLGIDDQSLVNNAICIGNHIFTIGGSGLNISEDLASMNIWNNGTQTVYYPVIKNNFGAQSD